MAYSFVVSLVKARLDKFLVEQLPSFSRSKIQRTIEAGGVRVNSRLVTESKSIVRNGDSVEYVELKVQDGGLATPGPEAQIKVLYNNKGLLIIDKPAGISVHPGAGIKSVSLSEALVAQFPEVLGVGEAHRPGIVHRLDKDTSGVMLVAKTKQMYEYLKDAFFERKVRKEYLALVWGVPDKAHGFIDAPIGKSTSDFRKHTTRSSSDLKPALTEYRVLETFSQKHLGPTTLLAKVDKMALISLNLHTGRTHQIRVHMQSLGHPLMGDTLYGGTRAHLEGLNRQFLHARKIEVQLPDGTWIEAESSLPEDLRLVLSSLGSSMAGQL